MGGATVLDFFWHKIVRPCSLLGGNWCASYRMIQLLAESSMNGCSPAFNIFLPKHAPPDFNRVFHHWNLLSLFRPRSKRQKSIRYGRSLDSISDCNVLLLLLWTVTVPCAFELDVDPSQQLNLNSPYPHISLGHRWRYRMRILRNKNFWKIKNFYEF